MTVIRPDPLTQLADHGLALFFMTTAPTPLKQFSDVSTQIATLRDRGMLIDDEKKAERYLKNVGYFRLSAYWHNNRKVKIDEHGEPITKNGDVVREDEFEDGTSFDTTLSLYIFDRQLRIIILDAIQRVEISVRARIVSTLGPVCREAHSKLKLGVYKSNFIQPQKGQTQSVWDKWRERQAWLLSESSRERFIKHYVSKHGSLENLPIWVAAEVWDFGCTSHLYLGLAPKYGQSISSAYGIEDQRVLETWMTSLNFVRNICAHHRRLWNRRITKQPSPMKLGESELMDHLWDISDEDHPKPLNNRVYFILCMLQYMMKQISPKSTWHFKVHELIDNADNPELCQESMGFTKGWKKMDLWN